MKITKKFYKDEDGWFIDLPEWPGEKAELAMVLGADTLLDVIADGDSSVDIEFSDENFPGSIILDKLRDDYLMGGAHYLYSWMHLELWLCDVTKFIFGLMPKQIFLKRVD
jgi:hypothetical protein